MENGSPGFAREKRARDRAMTMESLIFFQTTMR
jgi:hypothetical protein